MQSDAENFKDFTLCIELIKITKSIYVILKDIAWKTKSTIKNSDSTEENKLKKMWILRQKIIPKYLELLMLDENKLKDKTVKVTNGIVIERVRTRAMVRVFSAL